MIAFKNDCELFIVDQYDEATDTIVENRIELFKAGEPVDAEIVAEEGHFVQLKFGNGSQAFTVQRECFDVLPMLTPL